MNSNDEAMGPLTLVQATALDVQDWDLLSRDDLIVDPRGRERTAATWLWLLGIDDDGCDDARRARREVLTDAGLMVALNAPAVAFLDWFRRADWECFDRSQGLCGDAWAWGVMERARAAIGRMGAMAGQCPLRAGA
jgi:hypothetical protein